MIWPIITGDMKQVHHQPTALLLHLFFSSYYSCTFHYCSWVVPLLQWRPDVLTCQLGRLGDTTAAQEGFMFRNRTGVRDCCERLWSDELCQVEGNIRKQGAGSWYWWETWTSSTYWPVYLIFSTSPGSSHQIVHQTCTKSNHWSLTNRCWGPQRRGRRRITAEASHRTTERKKYTRFHRAMRYQWQIWRVCNYDWFWVADSCCSVAA